MSKKKKGNAKSLQSKLITQKRVDEVTQNINDGISSLTTALGEKSSAVTYLKSRSRLSFRELDKMYRNSWLVGQYINKTANDMLKKPRELNGKLGYEVINSVFNTERMTDAGNAIKKAIIWSKLFGDALIVAVTDIKKEEYESPLNIKEETIIKFITLTTKEYTPSKDLIDDITSINFSEPKSYQINVGKGLTVDSSRCLRIKCGITMMSENDKYGISEIQPAYDAIKAFDTAMTCISDLLQDSNVDVLFIPDLVQKLTTPDGERQMVKYVSGMKTIKSSTGFVLLDAGQDGKNGAYEQKQINFSGLSEVISKLAIVVGGALNRPLKILFGESAKGFATGEEDNTAYYETIHAEQESVLRKIHDFIDQFILHKQAGVIDYEFPSIDMPNDGEEATTFNTYATAFATLINSQGLSAEQAIRELKQMGYLESMTDKDIDDIKDSYLGLPNGVNQPT